MSDYDRIDKVILDALQENARTSYKELAALTGVAPSTCLERVRGLRARGVIAGFRAEVNLARLGRKLEALISIRFRMHDRELVDTFVEYLLSLPETVSLFNVTGDDDYLLHVAVVDAEHLHAFVLDRLGVRSEVERVRTSIVYQHLRKHPIAPVDDGRADSS
ncbi:MAG TPA: Lrp/AsnC family transcriptional regulator [Gaiellaceae bacterium]